MSFQKQIEKQLAQEFSPKQTPIVLNYDEAVHLGRRLHDQEMHRLLSLAWHAFTAAVKRLAKASHQRSIDSLPNYLRQDIGLRPFDGSVNGTTSRGYM